MAQTFDIPGKSGESYRYTLLEGQPIWPSGGNVLYVKMLKSGPRVLYAGETESLLRGYSVRWDEAQAEHGATDILLRLNISGSVRRAERDDLIAQYRPPMNASPDDDDDDDSDAHAENEGQGNGASA